MPLTAFLIVLALFSQVLLVYTVLFRMRAMRIALVRAGQVEIKDVALNSSAWPDDAKKLQNSYSNQFEMPVLFFAVVLIALHFGVSGWGFVFLSWAFALLRWAHMWIHTGSNRIGLRMYSFAAGVFVLFIQWVYVLVSLALSVSV